MSSATLEVFDTTIDKTNRWINEICDELGWDDRHLAYAALRATIHAVRDRLSVDEAAQLGAQLPMLIRGFYYEGWRPAGKPDKVRHMDAFLERIEEECRIPFDRPTDVVVRRVLKVLCRHVSEGEIQDITRTMPDALRDLWP